MQTVFLKAFTPYPTSPLTCVDFAVGLLHPRQEVLALLAVLKPVGKSSAAAFNIADSDIDTITATYVSKQRASWMSLSDAVNAVPDVMRDIGCHASGCDLAQLSVAVRNGSAVPATGGTAITFPIPLPYVFQNIQKETPNLNAYSGGQLYSSARCDIDLVAAPPALPTTIVLTNGSLVVSALTVELWAITGAIRPLLWMAGAQKVIVRGATSVTIEAEGGPLFDEFVFSLLDSATFPNTNDNIQIVIDGKNYTFQTPIQNLPFAYSMSAKNNIGSAPTYDVGQNTKARAAAARVGRVPFVYIPGGMNPVEGEWPVAAGGRSINFGAKTTTAPNLAFWRQTPITSGENLAFLATMLQDPRLQPWFSEKALTADQINQIKMLAFGDLAVWGAGSSGPGAMNSDLSLFKPRIFAPSRAAAGK